MNVYFIRHGETTANYNWIHQDAKTELSENGRKQAQFLANRLKKINLDLIVTSTYERTKDTANIIKNEINKPLISSDLFIEIKRPSEVEGLRYDDPKVVKIRNKIILNFHEPSFRHSDEESFYDLSDRSKKALTYLEELTEANILVVTHGDFIRCLLGQILLGNKFDSHDFLNIKEKFSLNNTAITLCEYKEGKWKLITWNDFAHLG
jgi:broad specificity phosphatase PhoE